MSVIGIDPAYAKPVAFAYPFRRKGRPLWRVGNLDPAEPAGIIRGVLEIARDRGATHAVIEGGYLGENPRVSLKLAEVRGRLEAIASAAGLEVRMVAPATWQAATLCQGHWHPKRHAEIVRQAILRARGVTGMVLPEDQAVAVCIAEWGMAHCGEGDA